VTFGPPAPSPLLKSARQRLEAKLRAGRISPRVQDQDKYRAAGRALGQMPCIYTFSEGKLILWHLPTPQISAYINLAQQTCSGRSLAKSRSVQGLRRPRRDGVPLRHPQLPGRAGLKLCPVPCATLEQPWDCVEVGRGCLHPPGDGCHGQEGSAARKDPTTDHGETEAQKAQLGGRFWVAGRAEPAAAHLLPAEGCSGRSSFEQGATRGRLCRGRCCKARGSAQSTRPPASQRAFGPFPW